MADSQIGAIQASNSLGQGTKDILTSVLASMDVTNTAASVTDVGGATLVQGNAAGGTFVSALVPTASEVSGTLASGNFVVDVALPAGVGLSLQGLAETSNASGVANFLNELVNTALPATSTDSTVIEQRDSLLKAIETTTSGSGEGQNVVVRVVNILEDNASNSGGSGEVVFKGAGGKSSGAGLTEVVAFNLSGVSANKTLVLENVGRSVIVGPGAVEVRGTTGGLVVGDNADQRIAGGTGADTLVGGGGHDTLVGGAGNDLFGFTSVGHFTLGDLSTGNDKLAFSIPGVTNIEQLASFVTNVILTGNATTYEFSPTASITLVGISPDQVTAGLIQFGTMNPGN